jgi:hypothetical protein
VSEHITQYGQRSGDRARSCSFDAGGFRVLVSGGSMADDDDIREYATMLAGRAAEDARSRGERFAVEERQRAKLASLEAEVAKLRALVPPKAPARLFGTGMTRFDASGALWLLDPVKQWRGFGIRCAGWDDLFRCYAVRVTGHGSDAEGPFWTVENNPTERA